MSAPVAASLVRRRVPQPNRTPGAALQPVPARRLGGHRWLGADFGGFLPVGLKLRLGVCCLFLCLGHAGGGVAANRHRPRTVPRPAGPSQVPVRRLGWGRYRMEVEGPGGRGEHPWCCSVHSCAVQPIDRKRVGCRPVPRRACGYWMYCRVVSATSHLPADAGSAVVSDNQLQPLERLKFP